MAKKYVVRSVKRREFYKKLLYITGAVVLLVSGLFLSRFFEKKPPLSITESAEDITLKEENKRELERLKIVHGLKSRIAEDEVRSIFNDLPVMNTGELDMEILDPNFDSKDGVYLDQEDDLFTDIIENLDAQGHSTDIEDRVSVYQANQLQQNVEVEEKPQNFQEIKEEEGIKNIQGAKGKGISKKEFIKKFVDNAKKAGYEVKLNDRMQVVSVRKIK